MKHEPLFLMVLTLALGVVMGIRIGLEELKEIDMTDRRNWKPIDAETILGAPIQDIGYKVILEDDCRSYAIDDDNKWWVCGFFNGKFCRVEAWPISPEIDID